jgi:hypothetical protein
MAAAVARGASRAAAARAASRAGGAAAGRGVGGAARAAASAAAGGGLEAAEARQEARAREFERFQTCVAAAMPSLGEPAPDSPEMERVDAELQTIQQQAMAAAMTGRGDAAQMEALQDRTLVLTARQMVLRYPELARRCGPTPAPATR